MLWRYAEWIQESETVFQSFVELGKADLPTSRQQLRASFPAVYAMLQDRHRNPIRDLDRAGMIRYLDRRGNYQITLLGWIVSQGDVRGFLSRR